MCDAIILRHGGGKPIVILKTIVPNNVGIGYQLITFYEKKGALIGCAGRDLYRKTIVSTHRIIRR